MAYTKEELETAISATGGLAPAPSVVKKEGPLSSEDVEAAVAATQEQLATDNFNSTQKPEEESFIEQVLGGPLQRSGERLSAMGGRIMNTLESYGPEATRASVEAYAAGLPQPDSGPTTDVASVLLQTVAEPVSIFFDSAGEALVFGAEQGIGLVTTDEQRQEAMRQFTEMLQTPAGNSFSQAVVGTAEALESWAEKYPNEAANLRALTDVSGMKGFKEMFSKAVGPVTDQTIPAPKQPFKISKIGLRKVNEPLKGEDRNLWNLAFNSGVKTEEQIDRNIPTALRGFETLASKQELDTVDVLKRAGIQGKANPLSAHNKLKTYLDKLDERLVNISRGADASIKVEPKNLKSRVSEKFRTFVTEYPGSFDSPRQANKTINKYMNQYMAFTKKHGYSVKGLRDARIDFDNWLEGQGVSLGKAATDLKSQAGRIVRESANEEIVQILPEAGDLLKEMSLGLKVKPLIYKKASETAETALGRYLQIFKLDFLLGRTASSQAINFVPSVAVAALVSPGYFVKRLASLSYADKGTAKFQYAVRDAIKAMEAGAKKATDKETLKAWNADKIIVYTALREAAQTLAEQEEQAEEEERGR
tara:strand:- start:49 stop:1821 length:1773 start_codon:yes stop_codon:yes gene_type:complete